MASTDADPIRRDAFRASLWRELVHGIAAPEDAEHADLRWCPIAETWVLEPWKRDEHGWYSDGFYRMRHGKMTGVTA